MQAHKLGVIGLGKIAQDQHLPVIKENPAFELLAVASQRGVPVEGVPHAFKDWREMLRLPDLDAVAICTPPQPRHAIARAALEAGTHVLLEKPPTASLSELVDLKRLAASAGRTLFTTWHSQYNRAVAEARQALAGRSIKSLLVTWKEDVRQWHPGQDWIWQAGGFGVFDPGINALSIVTRIMPAPVFIRRADLEFPSNKDAPIAATLEFGSGQPDEDLRAVFDWRQTGEQTWDIAVETSDGMSLKLMKGGSRLEIDGRLVVEEPPAEYEGIYRRFNELLANKRSEVDTDPFRLVADAFMIGRHIAAEPFSE
ncbi:MAG: Gfo/Idh/MocA family oxidoreductase [Pseudomonadota bacterium]|nr:Gfo/Idh/MocA family oxidoreductase [Pseudomonadota bacterium]